MRTLTFFIVMWTLLLPLSARQAGINARGIVATAEISGIDENELTEALRDAVHKLVGQPFDQQTADDLVTRIQKEKPGLTATTRLLAANEPDRVKVVFQVEKADSEGNVNSRYTIERVEIQGFDESKLSQSLRDDLQKLVGEKLDEDKVGDVQRKIENELRPKHYLTRKVVKGADREHIVLVYEVHKVPLIPFIAQPEGHFIYHSKEHFSAAFNANIVDNSDARLYLGVANSQDPLIERFAGFNVGLETVRTGTDHLGFALRYSRYREQWQPATVLADRNAIYRKRNTFEPTMTFAFDPHVRLTAGVSVSDLQIQYPDIHQANANAAVASLHFQKSWGHPDDIHDRLQADYEFRAGNHSLDSDFIYTRHLARAEYVNGDRNRLLVSFAAGAISGNAPLFERFSLGDSATLRGWNKFDVAPLGGNRMVHATLEYGFNNKGHLRIQTDNNKTPRDTNLGFHVFYDAGAVGDRYSAIKARHSAGFGIGSSKLSDFFADIAFPLRSSHVVPVFILGVRF